MFFVALRVHWLPEAGVRKAGKLAFFGEPLKRSMLPDGIAAIDVVQHFGREDKKSSVDPAFVLRLLAEACDFVALKYQRSEAGGRLHRSHCRQLSGFLVRLDQLADINVGKAVAVGEAKLLS